MKRFKKFTDAPVGDVEVLSNAEVTIPNQAMTPQEVLIRFAQNGTLGSQTQYYDDNIVDDVNKMGFEEIHELAQEAKRKYQELDKAARKKAKEDERQRILDDYESKRAKSSVPSEEGQS